MRTQPERGDSEYCEIILRVLQKLVLLHYSVCSYERIKITEKKYLKLCSNERIPSSVF